MASNSSPAVQQGATQGSAFHGHINPAAATTASAGNGAANLPSLEALKHDPGLAAEWSVEEQSTLEDGLSKYANELNILKYIKIAALLPEKTVRDVALRCRWMSKKENGKRRKAEEQNGAKKIKDKKEKFMDTSIKASHLMSHSIVSMYASLALPMENNNGTSYEAIGGTTGHLLEQNAQVLSQITANLAAYKIQENVELLCQTRDNLAAILNDMKVMPGIMSQMPPLPVKVNVDLAETILPTPQKIALYSSTTHLKQELR